MKHKYGLGASVAAIAVLVGGGFYLTQARTADAAGTTVAVVAVSAGQEGGYLPDPNRPYPERVLWGDEHVHTGWSMDAGISGATLTPEDAVRFVRGETVISNSGQQARLQRPLDWVAVTDHSDGMGSIDELQSGNPDFMADPTLRRWHDMMAADRQQATVAALEVVRAAGSGTLPAPIMDPEVGCLRLAKNRRHHGKV